MLVDVLVVMMVGSMEVAAMVVAVLTVVATARRLAQAVAELENDRAATPRAAASGATSPYAGH